MKRLIVTVLVVFVAACSSNGKTAAPVASTATTTTADPNVAPTEVVDVCRAAVKEKLVSPADAKFDPAVAPKMNTAGSSWQIHGTISTVNGAGAVIGIDYTCLINPSTLANDSVPWVAADVTVTPKS